MTDRVVLLGTGTCELDERRSASSVLVEVSESRFVFDIGRGVATRLHSLGYRQNDIGHIVLSHFHPDHFSDLIPYLHAAAHAPKDLRSRDLHVYGPIGLDEMIDSLSRLAGAPHSRCFERFSIHTHRIEETDQIDGLQVETIHLPPAGNHGIRFRTPGGVVAVTGDSDYHDMEVEFLREVDVAIVDSGHLSNDEIVELACSSHPGTILCSHIYRDLDVSQLSDRARECGFKGELIVAQDRMEVLLSPVDSQEPISVRMTGSTVGWKRC